MDQRDMGHHRNRPVERLINVHLPRRIGQMIVAADDMRDAHVVIVDDDGQHIGRRAVRAQQHEIVEIVVRPGDAALHLVLDDGLAGLRRLQADDRLDARRRLATAARSRQRPS